MTIDVSPELSEALRQSSQASIRLREAAKSSDRERYHGTMKEWLAAQQRRREAWLAMATPLPTKNDN